MTIPEHQTHPDSRSSPQAAVGQHIVTVATVLTCARIALTFPFLYLVGLGRFDIALGIFLVAAATDFADGYVARRFNQSSSVGRILDPLADKFLTASAFVVMALPHAGFPSIPVWLAALVVARDGAILAGAGAIYLLAGFGDFKPTLSGKLNTAGELALIAGFLASHSTGRLVSVLPYAYAVVTVLILISGAEYLLTGLKILRQHR
jgi:cardiolipin synthase